MLTRKESVCEWNLNEGVPSSSHIFENFFFFLLKDKKKSGEESRSESNKNPETLSSMISSSGLKKSL